MVDLDELAAQSKTKQHNLCYLSCEQVMLMSSAGATNYQSKPIAQTFPVAEIKGLRGAKVVFLKFVVYFRLPLNDSPPPVCKQPCQHDQPASGYQM